ncbi:hypothetical protein [uncultured Stenotrophomonas sp.]|uniref:hypothetical protein n=1 Tax=uncultured Stenotrophomonas sp. TaxID=165438 RepID=UPI0025DF6EE3|nr:hypothetical protein [uncultured Stenotrophomonas sp.]
MKPPQLPPLPAKPSAAASFIAVTAKLSLVIAAMALAWSLLQLLVAALMGRMDILRTMQDEGLPVPPGMLWLSEHVLSLSVLGLLLSIAFLAVSWALLRHREWGRIGFIVFLVLVALANFAFLPLIHSMFDSMQAMVPAEFLNSPQGLEMRVQLRVGLWTSLITSAVTALALAVLHGWLVIKLSRPDVRALFR